LPDIAPEGVAKLAEAGALRKYRPDELRLPAGGPGDGEWTDSGDAGGSAKDPDIRPAAAPMNPIQAMKERFVDAHLADTQKVADQLGIPVENILGVAALESYWGKYHFASEGNNYFGIHYPAPYAAGYVQAKRGSAKVATSPAMPTA